jgi:hypothetical protein
LTAYFTRNSAPPTAFIAPAGTIKTQEIFTTAGGATCSAIAYHPDVETDGFVGGTGVWTRDNTDAINHTVMSLPLMITKPYATVVAADAPVGYWRLDDTSGTTMTATYGSNGTYSGSPTLAQTALVQSDASSKAVYFNGTNRYLAFGSSSWKSALTE